MTALDRPLRGARWAVMEALESGDLSKNGLLKACREEGEGRKHCDARMHRVIGELKAEGFIWWRGMTYGATPLGLRVLETERRRAASQ